MEAYEAYDYAASWGSFMRSGDPGACMYGFDIDCRPQSEEHRQNVIQYMTDNRKNVEETPANYDEGELDRIDEFLEYIKTAPLKGQDEDTPVNRGKKICDDMNDVTYGDVLDAIEATDSNPFNMTIRSQTEWSVIAQCVNVGIDSHLEAISDAKDEFDNGTCKVTPVNLCVLLRRLGETEFENDDLYEAAWSLQSSILTTLGFNDSGKYVGREALGLE